MSSARPILPRLLLVLISTLVAVGLIEAGFRLNGYNPLETMTDGRELALRASEDPELVYELAPGVEGRLWDCDVSINSGGLRDDEYSLKKPDGVTRIIAMGDSITFGNGLPVTETWSHFFEANLDKRMPGTEVLNFGVGGYDLGQEIRLLETKGLAYDPDYVVLAYCVNDLATVSVNLETIVRFESFRHGIKAWSRAAQWLALQIDRDQLVHGMQRQRDAELLEMMHVEALGDELLDGWAADIKSALANAAPSSEKGAEAQHERLGWYTSPGRINRIRTGFQRLSELARQQDFKMAFFIVPYLAEAPFEEAWATAYRMVHHMAEAAGFQVIDVRPQMAKVGLAKLKMSSNDSIHPKGAGHRIMARVLFKESSQWVGLRPKDRK